MTSNLYHDAPTPVAAYRYFKEKAFGRLVFEWKQEGRTITRSQDYSDLKDVDFDPLIGIVLTFSRWQVTIEGKDLQKISENIDDKKICRLIPHHKPEDKIEQDEPYISRIVWERMREGM